MTMDELNKLEREINESYGRTVKNFQDYFQNDLKSLEIKKDIIGLAKEIFETSLRLIKQEKEKINKSLWGDI